MVVDQEENTAEEREMTHIKLVPNQMHVSTSILGVGSRNISCKIPKRESPWGLSSGTLYDSSAWVGFLHLNPTAGCHISTSTLRGMGSINIMCTIPNGKLFAHLDLYLRGHLVNREITTKQKASAKFI